MNHLRLSTFTSMCDGLQAAGPARRGRSGWRRTTTRAAPSGTSAATRASTTTTGPSTRASARSRRTRPPRTTRTATTTRVTTAATLTRGKNTGASTRVTSGAATVTRRTTTGRRAARLTLCNRAALHPVPCVCRAALPRCATLHYLAAVSATACRSAARSAARCRSPCRVSPRRRFSRRLYKFYILKRELSLVPLDIIRFPFFEHTL